MKTKIISIIILISVISGSCSDDFLNIPPKDALTDALFFENESDYQQAVNGIYEPLRNHVNDNTWYGTAEMRSDNTHYAFFRSNRFLNGFESISEFLDIYGANDKYVNMYSVINRANTVLDGIDNANCPENSKSLFKGEALFLRSFAYFQLVSYFGDVILFTSAVNTYDEAFLPRSPKTEVYAQIIADAKLAAELLPGKSEQAPGRPTSGAANTLLGNVHIVLEQWELAEAAFNEVESSNQYSLLSEYADIYPPSNKNHSESIFEVQFLDDATQGMESAFLYEMIPKLPVPAVLTGVSPSIMNERGGFNIPTPDLLAAYEDGDLRKDASIGYFSGESPESDLVYDNMPYCIKYVHPHSQFEVTGINWPVYRYAEVLLFLAEAINEQGGRSGDVLDYLNQVRSRAGLDNISSTDQANLREIIQEERRVEFAFENKRWLDLVRTGEAIEVMNAFGQRVKSNPQDYYYPPSFNPPAGAFNVTEERLLFAIPLRELELNPLMVQNPGY